jgi:hypothetical protein
VASSRRRWPGWAFICCQSAPGSVIATWLPATASGGILFGQRRGVKRPLSPGLTSATATSHGASRYGRSIARPSSGGLRPVAVPARDAWPRHEVDLSSSKCIDSTVASRTCRSCIGRLASRGGSRSVADRLYPRSGCGPWRRPQTGAARLEAKPALRSVSLGRSVGSRAPCDTNRPDH